MGANKSSEELRGVKRSQEVSRGVKRIQEDSSQKESRGKGGSKEMVKGGLRRIKANQREPIRAQRS